MLLFEREIKYQQEVERLKDEIQSRSFDWSIKAAFDAIDMRSDGYLNCDTFKLFLKVNGYTATINELDAIVRRIDSNSDYMITFTEFLDFFKPLRISGEDIFLPNEARQAIVTKENKAYGNEMISPSRCSPLRRDYGSPSILRDASPSYSVSRIGSPLRTSAMKQPDFTDNFKGL